MRIFRLLFVTLIPAVGMIGCGSAGLPEPIKLLENPSTGERERFYREIPYKVPTGYDEAKHLAEWTSAKDEAGFTKEITPEDDRERLAELRAKNLAAARQQHSAP